MDLLDPMGILCLIFLRNQHTVFHTVCTAYTPTGNEQGLFQFLHVLADTCCLLFCSFLLEDNSVLMGVTVDPRSPLHSGLVSFVLKRPDTEKII